MQNLTVILDSSPNLKKLIDNYMTVIINGN